MIEFDLMYAQVKQEKVSAQAPTAARLRAAIYVRKSNKDEGGGNKSCDEQLTMCLRVAVHNSFDVNEARIYREEEGQKGEWWWDDGSNYHPRPYRPELTRLMQDVEAGLIDVVVIWRSDRLYRDAGVCDALMKIFRARHIRFVAGVRDMDITSASGLYSATSEAANNRRWRDTISEDIKRDHTFKAELGMFSRDPTCLGFKSKGRGTQEVEVVWEQLALVNRIFTLFVVGEDEVGPLGVTGIANRLMDEQVAWPKGRKGHKFKHPAKIYSGDIRTVLENCMYLGRWLHDGQVYECEKLLVPVLDASGKPTSLRETAVPLTLFEAAQAKLAQADRPGKRSLHSGHLLTGLAVCARCGRPLQVHFCAYKLVKGQQAGEARVPRRNFNCAHRRGTRPCPPGAIVRLQEPVLDAWILEELAPLLHLEITAMRASSGREADAQLLADLERQHKEARTKETTKLASLVDVMDAAQFAAVATHLRAEREALERRISDVKKRLEGAESGLPDFSPACLQALPASALKDALARAIQWVAVGKTGVLVLTRWGSYVAAPYRAWDRHNPADIMNTTYLCPPDPAYSVNGLCLLSDPEEFVRGRRDALGRKSERLSNAELLPGVRSGGAVENAGYILEARLPAAPPDVLNDLLNAPEAME